VRCISNSYVSHIADNMCLGECRYVLTKAVILGLEPWRPPTPAGHIEGDGEVSMTSFTDSSIAEWETVVVLGGGKPEPSVESISSPTSVVRALLPQPIHASRSIFLRQQSAGSGVAQSFSVAFAQVGGTVLSLRDGRGGAHIKLQNATTSDADAILIGRHSLRHAGVTHPSTESGSSTTESGSSVKRPHEIVVDSGASSVGTGGSRRSRAKDTKRSKLNAEVASHSSVPSFDFHFAALCRCLPAKVARELSDSVSNSSEANRSAQPGDVVSSDLMQQHLVFGLQLFRSSATEIEIRCIGCF
jgi:hypothetical protein